MAFGAELFGSLLRGSPTMPGFKPVTPGAEETKAIGNATSDLPAAEGLASSVNTFNQEQLQKMLDSSIPGYENIKGAASGAIQDELAGKVPLSDQNMLQLSSVAKSFGTGTEGSGSMGNLVARDLGLTELSQIDKGISSAEGWMKTVSSIETPGMFNVQSMFLTPEQTMQQDTGERNAQFQHDWSKNLMDWQTSIGYAAADDLQSTFGAVQSMAGAAGGAGGGGGGM